MGQLEAFHFISASDAERMRNCLGPSTAFRPIAPNGNSTDGRQTFFQPARFADVCIMLAPMDPRLCARVPARSSNQSRPAGDCIMLARRLPTFTQCLPTSAYVHPMFADVCIRSPNVCRRLHHAGPVGVDHSMELQPGPLGSIEGTASSPGPQLQPVPAPMESIEETASSPGPWITRWNSNQVPWDPWLCILPAHGSMVVHRVPARRLPTFTQCLPTSAYFRPGRR
jgi:hypothetical protein